MNKSDLKNLIKSTIEEILQERTINVADKKDIPKDLEDEDVVNISKDNKNNKNNKSINSKDDDIVNISKDIKKFINKDKTQSDKLKNVGDRFKSKPVTLKDI